MEKGQGQSREQMKEKMEEGEDERGQESLISFSHIHT